MSKNPRNIDSENLQEPPTGIGTHATNRNDAEADERDNKAVGREAHRADSAGKSSHPQQQGSPGEPMTPDQAEHLRILSAEAAEPFDESLDRVAADRRIEDLQRRAGLKP